MSDIPWGDTTDIPEELRNPFAWTQRISMLHALGIGAPGVLLWLEVSFGRLPTQRTILATVG